MKQVSIKKTVWNQFLDILTDPSFQGVNRLFDLSFEKNEHRNSHRTYIFSTDEIKYYSVILGGRDFFD